MDGARTPLARGPRARTFEIPTDRSQSMQHRHLTASLVVLAVAAGTVAGCGSSSSSPSATATPKAGSSQNAARSGGANSLGIANFKFTPATLTVSRGARITVTNRDTTAHTTTADDGKSFDTGTIDPGSSKTITLSKAGTYKLHCTIHPFMHGTIVVR
jgi:plastocyanin